MINRRQCLLSLASLPFVGKLINAEEKCVPPLRTPGEFIVCKKDIYGPILNYKTEYTPPTKEKDINDSNGNYLGKKAGFPSLLSVVVRYEHHEFTFEGLGANEEIFECVSSSYIQEKIDYLIKNDNENLDKPIEICYSLINTNDKPFVLRLASISYYDK